MARIQQQIAVSVTIQRPELPARDEYMKAQYHTANSVRNFKGNAGNPRATAVLGCLAHFQRRIVEVVGN